MYFLTLPLLTIVHIYLDLGLRYVIVEFIRPCPKVP